MKDEAGQSAPEQSAEGDDAAQRAVFQERVRASIELLQEIRDNRRRLADLDEELGNELLMMAGQVARPGPYAKRELAREVRKRRRQTLRAADEKLLASTGIRAKRRELVYQTPTFSTPPVAPGQDMRLLAGQGEGSAPDGTEPKLKADRNCYICKKDFSTLHFFYDAMCAKCGDFNWEKSGTVAEWVGSATPNAYFGDAAISLEAARMVNDSMAEQQTLRPDRIRWLASLPWQHERLALEELDRALAQGAVGVMVIANIDGMSLTDPSFAPIWEAIDRRALPVLLHPTTPQGIQDMGMDEYGLVPPVGFTFDTTLAVSRMIFDGFFDRYPRLKLIASHGGGTLPYIAARLEGAYDVLYKGAQGRVAHECIIDTRPLKAGDIAETVFFAANMPEHANITRLEIMATDQATGPFLIHRREK